MRDIVVLSAARTPIGAFQGALAEVPAPKLGGIALAAALARAPGVSAELVSEVIMGNVLAAGLGQAPARQAAHHAGIPRSVGAVSIN
ncbi:MAG TPA: acetyl-CoA C-acetyltransferase, partial [Polyangia bacterium]